MTAVHQQEYKAYDWPLQTTQQMVIEVIIEIFFIYTFDLLGLDVDVPDGKHSMAYFKYFLINSMVEAGKSLPCTLDPVTFVNDCYFQFVPLEFWIGRVF